MWSLQVIVFSWVRCRNCRITPVRLVESAQWSAGLILSDHIRGSRIFMRWTLILQNALFCNVLFALLPSLIFCYGVLETNQRKPWPRGLLLFCKHLTVQKRKRNCVWFESVLATERFSGPKQLQKDFLRLSECLCKREIISATVSKRNCCPSHNAEHRGEVFRWHWKCHQNFFNEVFVRYLFILCLMKIRLRNRTILETFDDKTYIFVTTLSVKPNSKPEVKARCLWSTCCRASSGPALYLWIVVPSFSVVNNDCCFVV